VNLLTYVKDRLSVFLVFLELAFSLNLYFVKVFYAHWVWLGLLSEFPRRVNSTTTVFHLREKDSTGIYFFSCGTTATSSLHRLFLEVCSSSKIRHPHTRTPAHPSERVTCSLQRPLPTQHTRGQGRKVHALRGIFFLFSLSIALLHTTIQ
jgi:hypothetical protein